MINQRIFGTVYIRGEPVAYGKKYARYKNAPELKIGNSVAGKELSWIEVNGILVSDRNVVRNISWYELDAQGLVWGREVTVDGQRYILRLLGKTADGRDEWDAALMETAGTRLGLAWLWNCDGGASWTQEESPSGSNCKILRGGTLAENQVHFSVYERGNTTGWRPVLEPVRLPLSELVNKSVLVHCDSGGTASGILLEYTDYDLILATPGGLPQTAADGKFAVKVSHGIYAFDRSLVTGIELNGE